MGFAIHPRQCSWDWMRHRVTLQQLSVNYFKTDLNNSISEPPFDLHGRSIIKEINLKIGLSYSAVQGFGVRNMAFFLEFGWVWCLQICSSFWSQMTTVPVIITELSKIFNERYSDIYTLWIQTEEGHVAHSVVLSYSFYLRISVWSLPPSSPVLIRKLI